MKKLVSVALVTVLCMVSLMIPLSAAADGSNPVNPAANWFYNQLGQNAKALYDAMLTAPPDVETSVTLSEPIILAVPDKDLTDEQNQYISNVIQEMVQSASDAVTMDHPELFWFGPADSSISGSIKNHTATYDKILLTVHPRTQYAGADLNAIAKQVGTVVGSVPVSGDTRYGQLRSIQEWLVKNVTYDLNDPYAHEVTGSLLHGKGVCESYSKALKLICDSVGIPCVLVHGFATAGDVSGSHMWNMVQMEDGLWYAVDATWENPVGSTVSIDYFLVGSSTVCDGDVFSQSHQPDGDISDTGLFSFQYPPLSATAYQPAVTHVRPEQKDRGDLDGNGKVDTTDARLVLQSVVGKLRLTNDMFDRADVNWDGKVDTTDARLILQHVVGKITEFD